MKAVILAGGLGTRLSEETILRPKPMVEIGGKPILWHIMKVFSHYGIHEFIICCGYKGYVIKEYFANYFLHMSDVTFDLEKNNIQIHEHHAEPWKVTLIDTGEDTMTGGRLKRVAPYLTSGESFCFTYGDGLTDLNIAQEIEFHRIHGHLATVCAVVPPARFGALESVGSCVSGFREKPAEEIGLINGGFFVLQPEVLSYIVDDGTVWEREPMEHLARDGELYMYPHRGFWQPMDTLREKNMLEDLWQSGKAPWKKW